MHVVYYSRDTSPYVVHYGRKGQKWHQHIFSRRNSPEARAKRLEKYKKKQTKIIENKYNTKGDLKAYNKAKYQLDKVYNKKRISSDVLNNRMRDVDSAERIYKWRENMRKVQKSQIMKMSYTDMMAEKKVNRTYKARNRVKKIFRTPGVWVLSKMGKSPATTASVETYRTRKAKIKGLNYGYDIPLSKSYRDYNDYMLRSGRTKDVVRFVSGQEQRNRYKG